MSVWFICILLFIWSASFQRFLWGLEESGQLKTISLTTLFDSLASALSTELHMHKCITKKRLLTYRVKSLQQWLKLLLALSGSVLKVYDFVHQQLMFHKPVSVTGGNFLIGWVERCVPRRHLWHFIHNWGWWWWWWRRCILVESHLWSYMRTLHILQRTKTFNNSRLHSSESVHRSLISGLILSNWISGLLWEDDSSELSLLV